MYTHTIAERDKLHHILAAVVVPALRHALQQAGDDLVYQIEGFHPDVAYDGHVQAAANEMTALLCGYFATLSYAGRRDLLAALTPDEVYGWLRDYDRAAIER